MMPKLTKKHRTFDCDLSSSILTTTTTTQPHHHQQPPLQTQTQTSRRPTTTTMPNNDESNRRRHDDPNGGPPPPSSSSSSMISNEQCLSKLVLSSSMHQLAESKFHTNHHNHNRDHQNNHHNLVNLPDSTTPDSNDNIANMSNHSIAATDDNNPATCEINDALNDENNGAKNDSITSLSTRQQQQQQPNINNNTHSQQNANNINSPQTQSTHTQKTHHAPPLSRQQRDANLDTVHVVVGNESCDLDSAVSCLLMFHIISKMSDEINGKDKSRTLYIPLLNTTRDMLDGKCEVLWFLQKTLNIDKSFLTCKDDIDWTEIKRNGVEVLITLVDHNYNEEFKDIGKIVEIIDHHQIQNPEWLMENHANLRLTLDTSVGSCTTLVAERLFYIYAEHHVSDEILMLIYGTVLLDTICLSEKAKRFTRRDVYLLRKLDYLLGPKKPVRDELYKQLVDVKNSFRELSFEKLMKRDLKVYKDKSGQRVGIASLFGMAAREALGLAASIDLDAFFQQNQYEAFILMGLIADLEHSDSISRDLVLISANSRLFEDLQLAFEADTSKLDLQPIGSDSSPDPEDNIINNKRIVDSSNDCGPLYKARIWLQRNVTSSRKVVAPLVLKVLHDNSAMQ